MPARIVSVCLCLACTIFLLSSPPVFAKKMYRWVDEQGNTFLSDQIPPDQVKHRRESLNENGKVLDITEKAKTKEQLAIEAQLRALKKAQEKIIAEQKARDKVLLSTFRSLEDMNTMLKGKMQSLDTQKNVTQRNLKSLQDQLAIQQKQAAGYERNGEKIPQGLYAAIKSTETQIKRTEAEIARHIENKNQVKTAFEADMDRFRFLTRASSSVEQKADVSMTLSHAANELGLYTCENDAQCAKAWGKAHDFVLHHGTTPIDIDTDKLIMGQAPARDTDLSLSISKIAQDGTKQQLFLDISCRHSSLGAELCASQKALEIRSSFKPYIESALAND